MFKFYKFGFGKTTEVISEKIRLGMISRSEGIKIVEKYDGKCNIRYIRDFCKENKISMSQYNQNLKKIVNKNLFLINGNIITKKFKVGYGL